MAKGGNKGKHARSTKGSAGKVSGLSFSGNPSNSVNSSNPNAGSVMGYQIGKPTQYAGQNAKGDAVVTSFNIYSNPSFNWTATEKKEKGVIQTMSDIRTVISEGVNPNLVRGFAFKIPYKNLTAEDKVELTHQAGLDPNRYSYYETGFRIKDPVMPTIFTNPMYQQLSDQEESAKKTMERVYKPNQLTDASEKFAYDIDTTKAYIANKKIITAGGTAQGGGGTAGDDRLTKALAYNQAVINQREGVFQLGDAELLKSYDVGGVNTRTTFGDYYDVVGGEKLILEPTQLEGTESYYNLLKTSVGVQQDNLAYMDLGYSRLQDERAIKGGSIKDKVDVSKLKIGALEKLYLEYDKEYADKYIAVSNLRREQLLDRNKAHSAFYSEMLAKNYISQSDYEVGMKDVSLELNTGLDQIPTIIAIRDHYISESEFKDGTPTKIDIKDNRLKVESYSYFPNIDTRQSTDYDDTSDYVDLTNNYNNRMNYYNRNYTDTLRLDTDHSKDTYDSRVKYIQKLRDDSFISDTTYNEHLAQIQAEHSKQVEQMNQDENKSYYAFADQSTVSSNIHQAQSSLASQHDAEYRKFNTDYQAVKLRRAEQITNIANDRRQYYTMLRQKRLLTLKQYNEALSGVDAEVSAEVAKKETKEYKLSVSGLQPEHIDNAEVMVELDKEQAVQLTRLEAERKARYNAQMFGGSIGQRSLRLARGNPREPVRGGR